MKPIRIFALGLVILMLAGVFAFAVPQSKEDEPGITDELKLYMKALGVIVEAYVEDVNPRQLLYQAVAGMMKGLDKFSEFIEPERYEFLQIMMKGEYAGVGAFLKSINDYPVVIGVKPGSPAEQVGLFVQDFIRAIDGVSMYKKPIPEVSGLLRGEAGTSVTVTIFRPSTGKVFDVPIVRAKIEIAAVEDTHMVGKAIGYFRLSEWNEHTAEQADKTLEGLRAKGMKAIIIDLRDNDGGLMPQAVAMASRFLDKDKLVVSVKSKIPEQRKDYKTSGENKFLKYPLIILVNEKSASASEIFSACLHDYERAKIIGVKTFGKASVQSVIPFDDVSAMKLTTARYLAPKGESIDHIGITPDEVIENGPAGAPGADRQLLRALEIFREYM